MKKNGRFRNKQRYKCLGCGRQFENKRRPLRLRKQLWQRYLWKKQTAVQIAKQYRRSIDWIRRQLDSAPLSHSPITPEPLVFVADAFFNRRSFGVCVFQSPKLRKNLYWQVITTESPATYRQMRGELEQQGFSFQAIVLDGRRGVKELFSDIAVQMCQFHRIRAAYQSLKTNLPYLFTYQKYPELQIPNTTNPLDGKFSHVKDLLRLHRGLKKTRKLRLINEILSK